MLTPDYLEALPQPLVRLMEQLEEDILQDVARRIGTMALFDPVSESTEYQLWRYQQTRALRLDVIRKLAKASGKTEDQIRKLLQRAGYDTLADDDAAYREMGLQPVNANDSPALLNLLNAGYRQTVGSWRNLTATTANTVTKQFEDALDRAWAQVSSGAFDHKTAVKQTVDRLAKDMKFIEYPSGHKDTLEVAVRRAVLTGVNQTAAKLQLERMDEMAEQGFEGFVEVSAHEGARSDGSGGPADHAAWQGKVYHRGGRIFHEGEWYEDFEASTGFGTGEGLCGWNCRHNFHPFWPGISVRNYTDEQLEALNAANVEYNGEKYTRYQINQMQRALERKIRSAKRKYLAEAAAGVDATRSAVKLKAARQQLSEFIRATGGRADSSRTSVAGFGRSEASKATWAARKPKFHDITIDATTIRAHAITPQVIQSVALPFFRCLSGKMNIIAKKYVQELLGQIMAKPLGTEGTVSFPLDGKTEPLWNIGDDEACAVAVQRMQVPYISLHTHPDNMFFSPEDYRTLLRDDNMIGMGVVGNLGKLFTCEKGYGYNKDTALDYWDTLSTKYPEYLIDLEQRIAFAKEFMQGASGYGLTIHE